jgi:hypothetical protein
MSYDNYPPLMITQATLLADILHAAQRNAPVAWLRGPLVTYGNLVSVTGTRNADIRDCYATITVTGTRKVALHASASSTWAGELRPATGETNMTVSAILALMSDSLFITDPAAEEGTQPASEEWAAISAVNKEDSLPAGEEWVTISVHVPSAALARKIIAPEDIALAAQEYVNEAR